MNRNFISVIVCTYNRQDYIGKCLQSLAGQSLQTDAWEVVLVDNSSTDTTPEICHAFRENNPHINYHYVVEKTQGLSFARNRGIAEATGNLLVFMDDDATASAQYLEEILKFFSENPEVMAGGGRIYPDYETAEPRWMSRYLMPLASVIDLGEKIRIFPKNKYPIGANMFFRKEVFEKYSSFNTGLGRKASDLLGGEEKEIMLRLAANKEKIVYLPKAFVHHYIPESRLTLPFVIRQAEGIGRSEIIRGRATGKSLLPVLLMELIKWGASFVLFAAYLLRLRPEKGRMIIKFRYFVSQGMLNELKL
jgi:glycosyltransferase involved in cell wall biosynthesis